MTANRLFDTDAPRRPRLRRSWFLCAGQRRRWTARWVPWLFGVAVLPLTTYAAHAAGSAGLPVFYLDQHFSPVVRLDRTSQSEPLKAILAMYALQNGAGCGGKNEQDLVKCALTNELGLGANCSEEHLRLVRAWFKKTPNLTSRWNEKFDEDPSRSDALENLCYGQPDTASWQNIWEIIRVDESSEKVTVDAIFFGGSQHGRTRARYVTTYRIGKREVTVVHSTVTVLESSSKSIFEGR
jgi:hypothetical protein